MSNITIEQETALRAEIVAFANAIPGTGRAFDRRRLFTSRADFLKRVTETLGTGSTKVKEIRFCEVTLVNATDSDEGFADCPVIKLEYNLHLFNEFIDERADGSNSDRDFTAMLLGLRHTFNGKTFAAGKAVVDPGIMPTEGTEFTQFGADGFTDVVGHSKDLTLTVYYYDEAQP